jgi:hypothetical protein
VGHRGRPTDVRPNVFEPNPLEIRTNARTAELSESGCARSQGLEGGAIRRIESRLDSLSVPSVNVCQLAGRGSESGRDSRRSLDVVSVARGN